MVVHLLVIIGFIIIRLSVELFYFWNVDQQRVIFPDECSPTYWWLFRSVVCEMVFWELGNLLVWCDSMSSE
jgi:hypothetical protein